MFKSSNLIQKPLQGSKREEEGEEEEGNEKGGSLLRKLWATPWREKRNSPTGATPLSALVDVGILPPPHTPEKILRKRVLLL